jgi:hypothetical protein
MVRNRKIFIGTWLLLVSALICLPGFETRGLAMGLVIGYWPILLLGHQLANGHNFIVTYFVMGIMCCATVGLCAWVMDKANLTKKIFWVLAIAVIAGACLCVFDGLGFDEWKRSPAISQAMESPAVNYQPTRWAFDKQIVIPKAMAGGLLGLYMTSVLGLLWSLASLFKYRALFGKTNKRQTT